MDKKVESIVIKRRTDEGEIQARLDMPKEEFEKIISQYATWKRERKYIPSKERISEIQEINGEPEVFSNVDTEGFEKAIILMYEWSGMILDQMKKGKSFRSEIIYDAETLKTILGIYTSLVN